MREIKFRLYDKNVKNMYYELDSFDTTMIKILKNEKTTNELILMQFTGITNIKGDEIYEGDLIRVDGLIYEVFWDNKNCCWACETDEKEKANELKVEGYFQLKEDEYDCYELIGNIYENKELLKDVKND